MNQSQKSRVSIKVIAATGLLTAVAVVLQYIEFAIPIMPSFIKLDFSDSPELIGAVFFGPIIGVIIALLKNLIHMLVSQSGFVGELSNFLLGASFALTAGIVYRVKKGIGGVILAGILGSVEMALISVPTNYFVIYPLYYNVMGFPKEAVLGMYKVLMPSIEGIPDGLMIFNLPFTLVKGLICTVFTVIVYKPLRLILKTER
ncbi:MAG: ECF transporter S component [Lachnospiraceae bacterium]|nr:ECF transporter S component [Lachnospiraceae bacterium]